MIGGWAVGYHGYPRLTQDMDVWVEMNVENTRRILKSLERFGFKPGVWMNPYSSNSATSFDLAFRRTELKFSIKFPVWSSLIV